MKGEFLKRRVLGGGSEFAKGKKEGKGSPSREGSQLLIFVRGETGSLREHALSSFLERGGALSGGRGGDSYFRRGGIL